MIRIVESFFIKSAVKPADYPSTEFSDIAFVGKSNVGKSSMINNLLGRKMIAKVSSSPGKTRLINFFKVRFKNQNNEDGFMNFIDLPGYGYAKVSFAEREKWKRIIETYLMKRDNLKGIILLVDIRHKADKKDIIMLDLLKSNNLPYLVAATKSDKIKKTLQIKTLKKLSEGLGIAFNDIVAFSSIKSSGKEHILSWIEKVIL